MANSRNAASIASNVPQWSRWSGSTLVTMPAYAGSARNAPSLSSASATKSVAGAEVRVAAALVELAADRERRVGAAVLQRHREHRGGGRLAVRAGDGDAAVALHERRERLGPAHHAQPARRAPPTSSGLLGLDRRRDDDGVGARRRARRRGRRRASTPSARSAASGGSPWRRCRSRRRRAPRGCGRCRTCRRRRCRRRARAPAAGEVGGLGRHRSPPAVVRVPSVGRRRRRPAPRARAALSLSSASR